MNTLSSSDFCGLGHLVTNRMTLSTVRKPADEPQGKSLLQMPKSVQLSSIRRLLTHLNLCSTSFRSSSESFLKIVQIHLGP